MYIRIFKCECGALLEQIDTDIYPTCGCGKIQTIANLKKSISRPFTKVEKDFVSICGDGDFKPFYSPDLGAYIDSSKKLKDTLKEKGMVCLTESSQYRQRERELQDKASEMLSRKHWQGSLKK
jgi:hypothetical protein